jgi:hypothetical protein
MSWSEFKKSVIKLANGQLLQAFGNDENELVNRSPLEIFTYLESQAILPSQAQRWDLQKLGFSFEPIVLWTVSGQPIENRDSIVVNIIDQTTKQTAFPVNLTGRLNHIGNNVFFYKFAKVGISQNSIIQIEANITLPKVLIFGKKIVIDKFYPSEIVI